MRQDRVPAGMIARVYIESRKEWLTLDVHDPPLPILCIPIVEEPGRLRALALRLVAVEHGVAVYQ